MYGNSDLNDQIVAFECLARYLMSIFCCLKVVRGELFFLVYSLRPRDCTYMYFSKPRGYCFIFLSLEAVTCMCTYFSIFSKPWAIYVSWETRVWTLGV